MMRRTDRGRHATLLLGLILLAFALLSCWSTARFVRGATRVEGRVFFPGAGSTFMVEYPLAGGRKDYILVRRPFLSLYPVGKQVTLLVNPSVASDRLHPEFYSILPVTARVASPVRLWAGTVLLFILAVTVLALYFLSIQSPRHFRVQTRFKLQRKRI
jgi:hypothetical protein